MSDKTIQQRIAILDQAIKQRQAILGEIQKTSTEFRELSDFGWFLTLGNEPFGMMVAVTQGKESRNWAEIGQKLEREINYLIENRSILAAKIQSV